MFRKTASFLSMDKILFPLFIYFWPMNAPLDIPDFLGSIKRDRNLHDHMITKNMWAGSERSNQIIPHARGGKIQPVIRGLGP